VLQVVVKMRVQGHPAAVQATLEERPPIPRTSAGVCGGQALDVAQRDRGAVVEREQAEGAVRSGQELA
jgi:hypothetical protein